MAVTAVQVMADEQAHVQFLRGTLGSAAMAKPAINLDARSLTRVPVPARPVPMNASRDPEVLDSRRPL